MKKYLHPKFLPLLVSAAGLIGILLRWWTIGTGPDRDSLYAPQPIAWALLWIVTIPTLGAVMLIGKRLKNPGRYSDNFPASPVGAAGCALAALGILVSGQAPAAGDFLSTIAYFLRLLSFATLALIALNRYQGKQPFFLLHTIPCLYFALRIFLLCRIWSNETQIGVFLFPFLASICVMLASYQLACFDVNLGKRKTCLFWSLSAVYFSMLALPGSDEPLFYIGMAAWLLTNLCSLRPLKARKPQPAPEPAPEAAPEVPPAPVPETPAPPPAPALTEDMSYDDLLKWLEQE